MRKMLHEEELTYATFLTYAPGESQEEFSRFTTALREAQTSAQWRAPFYDAHYGFRAQLGCYTTPGGRVVYVIKPRHVRPGTEEIFPGEESGYREWFRENTEKQYPQGEKEQKCGQCSIRT